MYVCLVNICEISERWFWKMIGYFIAVAEAVKQTVVSDVAVFRDFY